MSTLQVTNIESKTGTSSIQISDDGDVNCTGNMTYPQRYNPNLIINGGFDVWQRGTSQTSSGYGSDDRWYNQNTGSSKVHSREQFAIGQTEVPDNPTYFSRTVVTSVAGASNYVIKYQRIESVTKSSGQTFTLSFYAKADASKNITIEGYQNFGTGGSPSLQVTNIDVQTVSLSTSWAKYTVNLTFPSVSGKNVGTNGNDYFAFIFWFEAGSDWNSRTNSLGQQSGTFDIAQVKLEVGSVATPWFYEDYGTTLAKCQRYYQRISAPFGAGSRFGAGYAELTTEALVMFDLQATMRDVPAFTYSSLPDLTVAVAGAVIGVTGITPLANLSFVFLNITVSSGLTVGEGTTLRFVNSTGWLAFDAEL